MVQPIILRHVFLLTMTEMQDVHGLIKALASESKRFEAADILISLGSKAVEPLLAALAFDNWKIRGNAAWALGEIGDRRAVMPLIEALEDDVPEVRATAGRAIQNIGTPAIEPLAMTLNSDRLKNKALARFVLSSLKKDTGDMDDGQRYATIKPI
jgi:bilin biosynthesis protein